MSSSHRPRPHLNIPTQASARPQSTPSSDYSIQVTPPAYDSSYEIWDESPSSGTPRARTHSMFTHPTSSLPSRSASASVAEPYIPFPEPQIYRSVSASASRPSLAHRHSRNNVDIAAEFGVDMTPIGLQRDPSMTSLLSSVSGAYYSNDDHDFYASGSADSDADQTEDVSRDISHLSLDSDDGVRLFQNGALSEKDEEWHKLVPPEARDALGKKEVQRQSVIFEVFKAEREYVADLEAVQTVFIHRLNSATPPIIRESFLNKFIDSVFGNLNQVLMHHQRMLGALFARQREQHPVVQSIADIVLDTSLKEDFRTSYEVYIKNYPLAESRHRKEMSQNKDYRAFVQSVSTDPRIRKRDLTTFLSRPVTRLPRLNLLLDQILKLTDDAHPDKEILPIILDILTSCVKSTQPGIEAAENKVKFWEFAQSLVFQKGELIDMDLYADTRSLVRLGPVARWNRTETGLSGWTDLTAALLDNYFLLTKEEQRPNAPPKRYLVSRPIPLSFLRLGLFNSPVESRRDGLKTHPVYPFNVFHAASRSRRYTLHVSNEAERNRWYSVFREALGLHRVRQDANMWFEPQVVTDSFFRAPTSKVKNSRPTGRVTSAVPFTSGDRKFVAVGCFSGVYVGHWGGEKFYRALSTSNPTSLFAIESIEDRPFQRLVVLHDANLTSYSLITLARVGLGQADPRTLLSSMGKMDSSGNIVLADVVQIGRRALVVYACRRLFQTSLDLHVLEGASSPGEMSPRSGAPTHFRRFGEPGFIAKDAHGITALTKTIAIATHDRIVILDPVNLSRSAITLVPDFDAQRNSASSADIHNLKKRLDGAKPLGIVRCSATELLVVYDSMGCYVSRHGVPSRSGGYIRWECKATSFASQGVHVLLVSSGFIEIRNILTGLLVQVVEGHDIRLLHSSDAAILLAVRGDQDDERGLSDKIFDLRMTTAITVPLTPMPSPAAPALWDDWDM
ncbi:unnamed protein product [Mycena citricolor]|uniref:Rho1 guanine nucleotide exchange factor 1 n=1 Tax=Mycena citricolor TaxID=2018698 RepID=A0AAD2H5K3_9AGAR|nr:unnamed protein product [Mycena citricolor]